MSGFVVVLLVALWVSILVPGVLRGRMHSPAMSIDSFERSMSILAADLRGRRDASQPGERAAPDRPTTPPSSATRRRTLQRRRAVLQGLGGAVVASAIPALVLRGAFTVLFAVLLTALVAYVGLLLQLRAVQEQARRTVRHLPVRMDEEPQDLPLVAGEER